MGCSHVTGTHVNQYEVKQMIEKEMINIPAIGLAFKQNHISYYYDN